MRWRDLATLRLECSLNSRYADLSEHSSQSARCDPKPDSVRRDGAVRPEGLPVDVDRGHPACGGGTLRHLVLFLSDQAGSADRGARTVSRWHRTDATRARMAKRLGPNRARVCATRIVPPCVGAYRVHLRLSDRIVGA